MGRDVIVTGVVQATPVMMRSITAIGKSYNINHYNLSAIIAADNKVDSPCAV